MLVELQIKHKKLLPFIGIIPPNEQKELVGLEKNVSRCESEGGSE